MRNPLESPSFEGGQETERKQFDEISEQEQIERFTSLKGLFADKDRLEKEEDKERANYSEFIENAYKYTDRFKIEGIDESKVSETFEEARGGNKIIKEALDFFLEVKKNQTGSENRMKESRDSLEKVVDENIGRSGFADKENHQLDVVKLKNMFSWSLKSFVKGGEKIGRKPGIRENEIEPLSEDLEAIIRHVNAFR